MRSFACQSGFYYELPLKRIKHWQYQLSFTEDIQVRTYTFIRSECNISLQEYGSVIAIGCTFTAYLV